MSINSNTSKGFFGIIQENPNAGTRSMDTQRFNRSWQIRGLEECLITQRRQAWVELQIQ